MPLDWVVSLALPDVRRLFENRLAGFMELETMQPVEGSATHYDEEQTGDPADAPARATYFVKDTRYNILSVHDFPVVPDQAWHAGYPSFRSKLELRINRFLKSLAEAPSVLFVRWSGREEDALALHPVLAAMTSGRVDLLLLRPETEARCITSLQTDGDGVCLVRVPDRPGDVVMWDEVLRGMSLQE